MTGHLLSIETGLGTAVANHLWQSSVFVVAVWLMALLMRRNRAQVRYGLWVAASVKFLIPFSLLIDLGNFLPKPQHAAISLQPTFSSAVEAVGQPFTGLPIYHTTNAQSLSEHFAALLPQMLAGLWVFGVMTVLLVWCVRWRQIHRALRSAALVNNGREVEMLRRLETLARLRGQIPVLRSRNMMEPGIFGIFRPVMLWPEGLSARLENEHLEAILAHELMHVRRHDNLTASIHMVVEAVFWFHPMVWWMESRMLEERERACDEAVVQLAARPEVYADSLLKACRFCAESPLKCVSGISGANLKKRIVRIMTDHVAHKLNFGRKLLLGAAGLASLAVPVTFGVVHAAQIRTDDTTEDTKQLKFADVSIRWIKPNKSLTDKLEIIVTPDGINATGTSLQMLSLALGVPDDQIVGMPEWVISDRFYIQAKVDTDDVPKLKQLNHSQRWAMLRPVFEERFGLRFHHETKEDVYALLIANSGPKLRASKLEELDAKPEPPEPPAVVGVVTNRVVARGASIESLIRVISSALNSTVVDKTELTGKYDYTLEWKPDEDSGANSSSGRSGVGNTAPSETSVPSLFTALQEQLGLKVESQRGPVDVIVIDHLGQPSPN